MESGKHDELPWIFHGKSCHSQFFWKIYEGDPLSPPEGEADQGENPLDPLIFLLFLERISHHPSNVSYSQDRKKFYKNLPAPPCLGEALRRGNLNIVG